MPAPIGSRLTSSVRNRAALLLPAVLLSATAWAQTPLITNVNVLQSAAGQLSNSGYSGDGGAAIVARMSAAAGVAVDGGGNVYFSDSANQVVRRVDAATGTITRYAGTAQTAGNTGNNGAATSAELSGPTALAVDPVGNLYIADQSKTCIRKIAVATGVITTYAGTCGSTGHSGDGSAATSATLEVDAISFDSLGNLYFVDGAGNAVRRVNGTNQVITRFAGTYGSSTTTGDGGLATNATFTAAYAVAADAAGNVYIADGVVIRKVAHDTFNISSLSATGLTHPTGMAVDASDNLYVADTGAYAVFYRAVAGGNFTALAGDLGSGSSGEGGAATAAQLVAPAGVALGPGGSVYVADAGRSDLPLIGFGPGHFPNTLVGSSSATQNVVISINNASLTLTSVSVPAAQGGMTEYTVGTLSGCAADSTTTYSVGTLCTIPITFNPKYPGKQWMPLIVQADSYGTFNFPLTGNGVGALLQLANGTIDSVVSSFADQGNSLLLGSEQSNGVPANQTLLVSPTGTAFDAAGDYYVADLGYDYVRQINAGGIINTYAGIGGPTHAGYTGDGYAALNAELNAPSGIALDAAGNLYIADQNNAAVRRVDAGTLDISTVKISSGPQSVVTDANGNVYVADDIDKDVYRIDAITGLATTVAGVFNGGSVLGDGGPATLAAMQPFSLALDSEGNLFIGDVGTTYSNGNSLIRRVDAVTGIITTVAGKLTGTPGTEDGDGGPATSANLDYPEGLAFDPGGNLYIADAFGNRIREMDAGGIMHTVAGSASSPTLSGFSTDPGPASASALYRPVYPSLDAGGDLVFADEQNRAVREIFWAPTLALASTTVSTTSTSSVALRNAGNAPLTVSSITFSSGLYGLDAGSTCQAGTTLAIGATCNLMVDFTPTGVGGANATCTFATSVGPALIPLSGMGVAPSPTTTVLAATPSSAAYGASISLTATVTVTAGGAAVTAGNVQFMVGGSAFGAPVTVNGSGVATLATTTLGAGANSVIADYLGAGVDAASASTAHTVTLTQAPLTLAAPTASPVGGAYGASIVLTQAVPVGVTGTISFYSGATLLGTGTVSAGVATLITTALPVGSDSVTTQFAGNSNYGAATSTAATVAITQATPTLAAPTASPAGGAYGASITLTQAVPVGVTGTISFYSGTTLLGTGTVSSGVATLVTTALPLGSDSITTHSVGNADYTAAISAPATVAITQATPTLAAPTASPAGGAYGASITLTQAVPVGVTGTISFYSGATLLGTGTVSSGVATLITTALPAGSDSVTTQFGGNTNYTSATSAAATVAITQATPTLAAPTASPVGGAYGASITLTQAVPVGVTGTISFYSGTTLLGTGTVSGGVATLTTTALPAGSDSVTTHFGGNSNYAAATSAAATVAITQGTLTLAAPTASPAGGPVGSSITLTQAVPVGATGTINFYSGTTLLGSGTISAGVATLITTALPLGSDSVTSHFGGNANYAAAVSAAATVTITQVTTLTAPTISPAGGGAYGVSITLTQPVPNGVTGTINFYSGTTLLGSGTISSGVATLTTTALPAGSDSVTGQFGGNSNYAPATSPAATVVITQATPTLAAPAILPVGGTYGSSITLTQPVPAGVTGTISFYSGTTLLGTGTISGGVATLTTTALPAGSDSVTTHFGGNTNYAPAVSAAVTVLITQATPALAAPTISPAGGAYGSSITLTQPVPAGVTGTIGFYSGTTLLGTGTVSGGVATLTTTALPAGSDSVTTQFGGNANYGAATSAAATVVITQAQPTLAAPTISPAGGVYGSSITLRQAVPPGVTGTISFYSGTMLLGTGTVSGGVATLTTTALPVGSDSVTAQFAGNTNYAPATSAAAIVVITSSVVPTYTITANPSSLTIHAGSVGTTLLTFTPVGNYSGNFTMACNNLPANAVCQFLQNGVNNPQVVLDGSNRSVPMTLNVITDHLAAQTTELPLFPAHTTTAIAITLPFGLCGLFTATRRRRQGWRHLPTVWMILAVATLLCGLSGCGSGGFAGNATPAGNYALQVTATASATGAPTNPGAAPTPTLSLNVTIVE